MKRNCYQSINCISGMICCFFSALILLMMASCPDALEALEKSSKKECAMCHVMWLDAFRTDKETLIKFQPGNVLMKDTQGIVSSEEICYSCHDGYVEDSRYVAWKGNTHTTFKKPSENVQIPQMLPLSNKDEIYCGTCHSPHNGRSSLPDVAPDESIPGPMSFLRLTNSNSILCEACHVNEADFKRTKGHPLHTAALPVPDRVDESESQKPTEKNMVFCQSCHRVHGAAGRHLTAMENNRSALCMTCHKEKTVSATVHDLGVTLPDEANINGQKVTESGPCSACHVPHKSGGYRLSARKYVLTGNPASEICLSCHNIDPDKKIKDIGTYSHPINIDGIEGRNGDIPLPPYALMNKLPLFSPTGVKQQTGTIQCATCHNLHQWDPIKPDVKGGKDIEGNASNSFLRIPADKSSALCVACHKDKSQLLSFDHNLSLTAPEAINIQGFTADVSGSCGACHIPHNAGDKILWARGKKMEEGTVPQRCTGCHIKEGLAKDKPIGKNDHPVNMELQGGKITFPEGVANMLPFYSAKDGTEKGGCMTCRTCHDPHIWSVENDSHHSSPQASGKLVSTGKNTEGDARNSFLRLSASPSPALCVVCHEKTGLLVGTDHDLFVTAKTETNVFGQTVTESGQCGVCHAAHNSPETHLLWSQGFGPVEENQHSMNGLCTCCHSKNGIAEKKVPAASTHPPGMLINNIMSFGDMENGYIKIFDSDFKESNTGDLSCTSCHTFDRWDHRMFKKGTGENTEGNADTSFLRTSSNKSVCIDCHGETAIWRYTYFHSVEKRKILKGREPQ